MKKLGFERINIIFPQDVARKLRQAVPSGERSRVVVEATRKALEEKIKPEFNYEQLLNIRRISRKFPKGTVVRWVHEDRATH